MAKRPIRVSNSKSRIFVKGEIVKDEDMQEYRYANGGDWNEETDNFERIRILRTVQVEQRVKYFD